MSSSSLFYLEPMGSHARPNMHLTVKWLCRFWITGVLMVVINAFQLHSQVAVDTVFLQYENIGVDDGLTAGAVTGVAQDSFGFLWLATPHGLNRYDGYEVRQYQFIPGDSLSLQDIELKDVFVDSRGLIWISSMTAGLILFNPVLEEFHTIGFISGWKIYEDPCGNIWTDNPKDNTYHIFTSAITGSKGLDLNQIEAHSIQEKYPDLRAGKGMGSLIFTQHGAWQANSDSLLMHVLDCSTGQVALKKNITLQYPHEKAGNMLATNRSKSEICYIDGPNLVILDAASGEPLKTVDISAISGKSDLKPRLIDQFDRVWVTDDKNQLYRIHTCNSSISLINAEIDPIFDKWRPYFQNVFIDRNDNFWMPSLGYGVYKYNSKRDRFKYYGDAYQGLSMPSIQFLSTNKLFISESKVLELDMASGRGNIKNIFPEESMSGEIRRGGCKRLFTDQNGRYYVAYMLSGTPRHLLPDNNGGFIDEPMAVNTPLISDSAGTVRLLSYFFESGEVLATLYLRTPYDGSTPEAVLLRQWIPSGQSTTLRKCLTTSTMEVIGTVEQIVHAGDEIWLGLKKGGVFGYRIGEDSIYHYFDAEGEAGRSGVRYYSILRDPRFPDSLLWLATSSGIELVNTTENSHTYFSVEDGLPNNVVYGILPDNIGNLWASTNGGLARFNPRTMEFRNFTKEDGIQHNEFNEGSYAINEDGIMAFGGIGGLTFFDPMDFYSDTTASNVVLTAIYVNNQKITHYPSKGNHDLPQLTSPVEFAKEVRVKHQHRMIEIEFATLDLTKSKGNEFKYKLDGFDKEWIHAGTRNIATYTNLPSGKFTFRVQGANSEKVWNISGATLSLIVIPPWWDTWWFKVAVIAIIVLLLFALYKFRMRQEARIQMLRNRISRDLHDEIGSTLSSISLFGTVAEKKLSHDTDGVTPLLSKINESATSVMESMNDIVWAIDAEHDRIEHLVNRMRAYTSELSEATNWKVSYRVEQGLFPQVLDMVHKRNVYLIFKEAVNNAFKYAMGSQLWVTLQRDGDQLILAIRDNGKGFDYDTVKRKNSLGGNGLKNMQVRGKELNGELVIHSSPDQGTEITFQWKPSYRPKI